MDAVKEYTASVDSKRRVTLRGSQYQYYRAREFENGVIILEPRELVAPFELSARTLEEMDRAVENFRAGDVSDPIDLSDF